jgi:hypothetical protein
VALVGIICPYDGTMQEFDTCIACHEGGGKRNCDAPVELLKSMRDNHIERRDAGWSASTLLDCPRAVALREHYDFYEAVSSGWNKARGTWLHAMMEADTEYPEGVVKEERIEKYVDVDGERIRITGKPDYTNTKRGVLIDYKSKHLLPSKLDPRHEAQFNIYAWLWNGGTMCRTNEQVFVQIKSGGMHYITWHAKEGMQFRKMAYPVWDASETEAFVITHATPLVLYKQTNVLPHCQPFIRYPGKWQCDCVKLEQQLFERGIEV